MKNSIAALAVTLSVMGGTVAAQDAHVRSLLSKDLAGFQGKELTMIKVTYPPGNSDPVHVHGAQSLIYVLEGSVTMQLRGHAPVTLSTGETFYEGPHDIHVVGRNVSSSKPAKLLVFLVKDKGAPILTTVK